MGQDISTYTDNIPNITLVPHLHWLVPHLQKLKPNFKIKEDGYDFGSELKKLLDHTSSDATPPDEKLHLQTCEHYRTSIGSPSIHRRSFTEEEIERFIRENDGFPLPCTEEEIKAFDRKVFTPSSRGENHKRSKKRNRDRQRSKSATSVPDITTLRQKLQKLQTPGKPKFLEHLINRVVSKKIDKNRYSNNGIIANPEELPAFPEEPLSPDSEKCLAQAECIVEELLASAKRPASGESTDSGKGSLLESTSDFSPTQKRTSWSTPTSPTFHGIVKQRLRSFQVLQETSDTESVSSQPTSNLSSPKQKSFQDGGFAQDVSEINKSIKQFYCALSEDENFNSAVMESGYVKALVAKINTNKADKNEVANKKDDETLKEKIPEFNASLRSVSNDEDSGWDDWIKDNGEINENEDDDENTFKSNTLKSVISGDSSITPTPTPRVLSVSSTKTEITPTPTPKSSSRPSSTSSSNSRANSVSSSRTNSVSDNDNQEVEDETPKDRLHQITYEMLTTERAYVARLHLLDQVFHFNVSIENKSANILPTEVINQMFANIKPIYLFHNDFLLPQLEARMKNWSQEQKIGDIMAKLAPFLKLYTEYVKNYDKAMALIEKWTIQSPKFAALLQEIQSKPECGQLTLQHHMLEPIQRVPRYEMLLKDYIKHLDKDASDRVNSQKALDLVTEAARHSNTAMKKIDKFHKLLSIIQRLNGEGTNDLVSPTRELVKEGVITKISARSGEKQARYLFLFNDLLLVCSEQIMGSYKLRARLSVDGMDILPGENITIQNTFCVKCTEKTIEFLDEANNGNGLDWLAAFEQVITDYQKKIRLGRVLSDPSSLEVSLNDHMDMGSQLGKKAPMWVKDEEVTMCMACQDKFTKFKRRHHCRACGKVYCGKCSSRKVQLEYDNNQLNRVCQKCHDTLKNPSADDVSDTTQADVTISNKSSAKQVEADKAAVLSCYLHVMDKGRTWRKQWITVHNDFVMYFYRKNKDVAALQTLPLPGHSVKVLGNSNDRQNVFSLTHKDTSVCYFQADSELQFHQWVRILEKMVQLQLPSEEDKRLSTHSIGSNNSNSSDHSGQSSQS